MNTITCIRAGVAAAFIAIASSASACENVRSEGWSIQPPEQIVLVAGRDPCDPIPPTNHKFKGNKKIPLEAEVVLCHPNWDNLNRKWYSYAIFVDGQLPKLVKALRQSGSWNQEVELSEGQRCHKRFFGQNWRFAVFDPCVVEGYNVLRIARPEDGSILDSFDEWPIVRGTDGKPLLFKL